MKGLLIKEFYNLKNYLIIYYLIDLFMFILYFLVSLKDNQKNSRKIKRKKYEIKKLRDNYNV